MHDHLNWIWFSWMWNECICVSEYMSMTEWLNQNWMSLNEWLNVTERMNVTKRMNECHWVNECHWMNEWVSLSESVSLSEWMTEWLEILLDWLTLCMLLWSEGECNMEWEEGNVRLSEWNEGLTLITLITHRKQPYATAAAHHLPYNSTS